MPIEVLYSTAATSEDLKALGYTDAQKIVRTSKGELFIAYRRKDAAYVYRIYVARSADRGQTWQEIALPPVATNDHQRVPAIEVDDQDRLHVIWYGQDENNTDPNERQIKYSRSDDGLTFTPWVSVGGDVPGIEDHTLWQEHPIIAVEKGVIWAIWQGKDADHGNASIAKISQSFDDGVTWTAWRNLNDAGSGYQSRPTLVFVGDRAVVFAYGSIGNTQIVYSYSDDQGATWAEWAAVAASSNDQRHPSAVVDRDGVIHVVWREEGPGGVIEAKYSKGGVGNWTASEAVYSSLYHQFFPTIGVTLDTDQLWVAWVETPETSGYPSEYVADGLIYFAYRQADSAVWTVQKLKDGSQLNWPSFHKARLFDSGYIHFVFQEGTDLKAGTMRYYEPKEFTLLEHKIGGITNAVNISNASSRPNPAGIRIAAIGTSITAMANTWDTTKNNGDARGYMEWLNTLTAGRVEYVTWLNEERTALLGSNKGVGGDKSEDILARVDSIVRMRPDICVVDIGGNDMTTIPYEDMVANTELVFELLLNAGILCISMAVHSKGALGNWPPDSEARHKMHRYNTWKYDYARRKSGVIFVDPSKYLVDPADPNGYTRSEYVYDGTHFTPLGAYQLARCLAEVIEQIYPAYPQLGYGADNVYHAVHNPLGNMMPNPMYMGAGGTANHGSTGVVPDDYQVNRGLGTSVTAVCSVEDRPDISGRWFVLDITPGGGTVDERLYVQPSPSKITAGVVVGEFYQAECDIEVSGGYTGLVSVELKVKDVTPGGISVIALHGLPDMPFPGDFKGRMKTPVFQAFGVDGLQPYLQVILDGTVAGSPKVKLGGMTLRRVENPALSFNGG